MGECEEGTHILDHSSHPVWKLVYINGASPDLVIIEKFAGAAHRNHRHAASALHIAGGEGMSGLESDAEHLPVNVIHSSDTHLGHYPAV